MLREPLFHHMQTICLTLGSVVVIKWIRHQSFLIWSFYMVDVWEETLKDVTLGSFEITWKWDNHLQTLNQHVLTSSIKDQSFQCLSACVRESHDLRIFQYLFLREDHQLRIGEGFVFRKPNIFGNEVYDWVRSGNWFKPFMLHETQGLNFYGFPLV